MSSLSSSWIAFGQASPVLALSVVCLACAAIVGLVLGGVALTHRGLIPLPALAPRTRTYTAVAAGLLGSISLGLMLRLMAFGELNWIVSVGLYAGAMVSFVSLNLCQTQGAGAESHTPQLAEERKKAA